MGNVKAAAASGRVLAGATFSHFLPLPPGTEMLSLLELRTEITGEDAQGRAMGQKEVGSLILAGFPDTSPGSPTSGLLPEKKINSCVFRFSDSNSYRYSQ